MFSFVNTHNFIENLERPRDIYGNYYCVARRYIQDCLRKLEYCDEVLYFL